MQQWQLALEPSIRKEMMLRVRLQGNPKIFFGVEQKEINDY